MSTCALADSCSSRRRCAATWYSASSPGSVRRCAASSVIGTSPHRAAYVQGPGYRGDMRGAVIHGAGDVRFEERPDPELIEPTDAVIRTVAACVCGSDLWRYRGIQEATSATPIGHENVGIVEQMGDAVTTVTVGNFVVGGFLHSDNTCAVCAKGMHANCQHVGGYDGCQAEKIRIPNADGTLPATPGPPDAGLTPSLLALSDVMATGWHAAVSADVQPGSSVVVV